MAAKLPGLSQEIKLEGESEYRAKLKEISAGLRVLDSEMDKTRASFEGQEKSVEALSATQDVLSRKLSTQHERVETLRAALQQSAQTFGEADQRTMSWQAQLNKAEAEELRLQHQIEGCSAAMREQSGDVETLGEKTEGSTREMRGLGDAVGEAASKLGINLPQGATNALNGLGGVSAGAAAALAGFAALAAGVAKVEKALLDMTRQSAESADELETLSLKTGLTTQTLQELEYAAEFIDVDLNTITGSLAKLTRSMDGARDGSGAAAESFAKLGIAVTNSDGTLRSAEDIFYEAIDALGQVQGATERDALAMDLFGRSAQDLNPLIVQGSDALRDLAKEANASGYVLDDFAVKKLTAVDDGFKKLEKSRESFTKKLSVEFAPATEKALGALSDQIDKIGDSLVKSGAEDAFGEILVSVTNLIEPLGTIMTSILPAAMPLLRSVAVVTAGIADTISLIAAVLDVKNWGSGKILGALGWDFYNNPNNTQRTMATLDRGWSWDSATGSWSDPNSVDWGSLQAQYEAWTRSGGAGTFEYWKEYVYSGVGAGRSYSYTPGTGRPKWTYTKAALNAAGTDNWRGGLTWVGENGPELLALPRGAQITSASESREVGGDTFNFYVDTRNIRELNDLVRIAQNARMNARKAVS